jgi:DNA-binding response OmpR family regulator
MLRTAIASNGEEALEVLYRCDANVDILITGVDVPKMNGKGDCQGFRRSRCRPPLTAFVTAAAEVVLKAKRWSTGA